MESSTNSRSAGVNCSVFGCNNYWSKTKGKSPKVHYYRFPSKPQDAERKRLWIRFVKRMNESDGSDWEPDKNSRICSQHFADNEAVNNKNSNSYLPSIYPEMDGLNLNIRRLPDNSRFTRLIKRQKLSGNMLCSNVLVEDSLSPKGDMISPSEEDSTSPSEEDSISPPEDSLPSLEGEYLVGMDDVPDLLLPKYREIGTQTDESSFVDLPSRGTHKKVPFFNGYSSVEPNDTDSTEDKIHDLTSVSSDAFLGLFDILTQGGFKPHNFRIEDLLLIFLLKFKHNLPFEALAILFNMKTTTVRKNFYRVLDRLSVSTKGMVFWPSKKSVRDNLPDCFLPDYADCRAIIDCTEIRCEKPGKIQQANEMYSSYKSAHTVKVLIAATPNGYISFISRAYGGRSSDPLITNFSGFLDLLSPGDVILADKGFPIISTKDVITVIPPRKGKNQLQFTSDQVKECEDIARIRINIERVIQRLKIYNILTHKLNHNMLPHIDKILHVCAVLVNLQTRIIKSNGQEEKFDEEEDEDGEKIEDNDVVGGVDEVDQHIFKDGEEENAITGMKILNFI